MLNMNVHLLHSGRTSGDGKRLSAFPGKPEFRRETAFVAVSAISEQFFCEHKVENEFAFGEIPTETKDAGTELHDELIPQEAVTKDQFVKLVERKKPSFAVLGVWGNVGGLRIVGMPDHIVWS
ncbi:MAG: hypothetical protein HY296_04510 [Thaumarchaeota archaeon]|nr:hypothetical protein [Nitrososphaerota archaeon]